MSIIRYLEERACDVEVMLSRGQLERGAIIYVNGGNYEQIRSALPALQNTRYQVDSIFFFFLFRSLIRSKYLRKRQCFDFSGFADGLFKYCGDRRLRVFVAGGTAHDIKVFTTKLRTAYSEINFCGQSHGYIGNEEILESIKSAQPDMIILGLGNGRQEEFAVQVSNACPESSVFTCGGFISQTAASQGLRYYPILVEKLNIRWLYRLIKESHTRRRLFITYPKCALIFVVDLFRSRL